MLETCVSFVVAASYTGHTSGACGSGEGGKLTLIIHQSKILQRRSTHLGLLR